MARRANAPQERLHPDLVRQARRLARRNPADGTKRSLREVAAELERLGYRTALGRRFGPGQVKRLLAAAARPASPPGVGARGDAPCPGEADA